MCVYNTDKRVLVVLLVVQWSHLQVGVLPIYKLWVCPSIMFYIISVVFLLLQVRNFRRFSWLEWVFIIVGLFAFIVTLGFTVERFFHFEKQFNISEKLYQCICLPNDSDNCIKPCHHWTCLSDFTFAIILFVNLSEKLSSLIKIIMCFPLLHSFCLVLWCGWFDKRQRV